MTIRYLFTIGLVAFLITSCTAPTAGTRGERTVALQSSTGAYVNCNLSDGDPMRERLFCKSPYIGAWEKFTLMDLGDHKVALRAKNMKFVAADLDKGAYLVADRDAVGPFETFELVAIDGEFNALKAHNGQFVLMPDSTGQLFATAADIGAAQHFKLIEDPKY